MKYQVGDRVKLVRRIPPYISLVQNRPRTVKEVQYNPQQKCSYYLLGCNGKGNCVDGAVRDGFQAYWFRSYQLAPWNVTGKNGRPRRIRRQYRRRNV